MRALKLAAAFAGVGAEHVDAAPVPLAVALEDLDGGRLAGAVRAEQREDLAGLDAEADAVQDLARVRRTSSPETSIALTRPEY